MRCRNASYSCLDCNKDFYSQPEWKTHTSCISEAEKYEKSVYKGKQIGAGATQQNKKNATSQKEEQPQPSPEKKIKEKELEVKKPEKRQAEETAEQPDKKKKKKKKNKEKKEEKERIVAELSLILGVLRPLFFCAIDEMYSPD